MTTTKLNMMPPFYCQYSDGKCDQILSGLDELDAFFIYPSEPVIIASNIRECVQSLQSYSSSGNWKTWETLKVGGHIIYCEICKAIRSSKLIVADITTLNFNVLFEIGYALGLGKKVLPVRDETYQKDNQIFNEIGIFDTLGYVKYNNSKELLNIVRNNSIDYPAISTFPEINKQQPIYYVKSHIDTNGSLRILSLLKKCAFRFRTFDPREVARLSLHESFKQVMSSVTVIAHLMDMERSGAITHNARAAFVCGMAMAAQKHVLMLQEGNSRQPIDYRDVILPYTESDILSNYIEKIVHLTADKLIFIKDSAVPPTLNLLEKIDIGDVAAENEIQTLNQYFVKTPQFQQVRQGHARLVIGRKGTGKSALFYGIRSQFRPRKDKLVLDLKPEGHQFTKLKELLSKLKLGLQEETLIAFWHYLLLLEILKKILYHDIKDAYRDEESLKRYNKLQEIYNIHVQGEGDFSERLMNLIYRLESKFPNVQTGEIKATDIIPTIYSGDIHTLNDAIFERLKNSEGLWILFDNIDKGFPSQGLTNEDILIVRCLLEATRKIQNQLDRKKVECFTTIFLRRDVYEHLIDKTPDRGKESIANLDWSDNELIIQLLQKRFQNSVPDLSDNFEDLWATIFDPNVGAESSINYITSRTFLRPRDILNFVRKCIQVAVSRGHQRVYTEDIKQAEKEFSEDMLNELRFEIRDVFPNMEDILTQFLGNSDRLSKVDIFVMLDSFQDKIDIETIIDNLLWFSFIGVYVNDEEHYSFQMQYNISKMKALVKDAKEDDKIFVIHPAFRASLII